MNAATPSSHHPIIPSPHHPPSSTYRVQLNADFTFADTCAIVPYLARLGIGALYTSPFLCATPGSTHGYDVTDYGSLNPEIGAEDDLHALTDTLRAHGMGLLVDVVPNHMGIAGGANAWWQDVLENARTSAYADFFDIDWRPLKEELRGKILLPVLGDHYGVVLERGELHLAYADGAFTVHYFETKLPIAPPTYPMILADALHHLTDDAAGDALHQDTEARPTAPSPGDALPSPIAMAEGLGVRAEFQSIITAFERLPPQHEQDPERIAERRREQIVAKRRLADLATSSSDVAHAIAEAVRTFNGDPAQPYSFDALDRLLDAQSYRLSSFRTAGEEINYRRFFAINELAAVRQEVPDVFAAAHALLLRLVAGGQVTGLRIDHPDGLWDPAGYFRDLQRAAWDVLNEGGRGGKRGAAARGLRGEGGDRGPNPRALSPPFPPSPLPPFLPLVDRLPIYLVVEKILEPGETLPNDWAVHGTVGYEFARLTTGLFVDPAAQRPFDDLYTRIGGEGRRITFLAVASETKNLILRTALASETNVLARALNRISEQNRRTRDFTLNALRHALREVITAFPVYRTYVACGESEVGSRKSEEASAATPAESSGPLVTASAKDGPTPLADSQLPTSDHDRRAIEQAVALAKRRNPASDLSVFDFLEDMLLLRDSDDLTEAERRERCRFVMKFQQLTGPVMAKGVEDTAFYRYNRLVALNEVGSDPAAFGVSVAEFHRANTERARHWPHGLLTSSTHDTKRSEDVRARIAVLSEVPREWRTAVNRW
ncbi:MAG: hypothetical protein K0S78_5098, partial [Thermomicrobiales bacterium]|nr:hypothetical protein [Thermomicrobiales bacterium]